MRWTGWWVPWLVVGWLSTAQGDVGTRTVDQAIEPVRPTVVMVESERSFGQRMYGSGFLISSDGLVATCQHVVTRSQDIFCYVRNKDRIRAKVVAEDRDLDLAVLKLQADGPFPTVVLGDSDLDVAEGSAIGLCGYPEPTMYFNLGVGLDSTATSGTVSGLRLGDRAENRSRNSALQLDVSAWPGSSGSPVFRIEDSKVEGMLAQAVFSENVFFAVPVNQLKALLASKNLSLKPAPIKPDDTAALTMEPGTVDTLVAVRDDREVATSFITQRRLANQEAVREQADLTTKFFVPAFGYVPSVHPAITVEGRDLYLGGLDSAARCFRQRRLSVAEEWSIDLDYPVYMPAALTKDNVVMGAGRLSYAWRPGSLDVGTSVLRAVLGGMFGGLFGGKARLERTLNTEGCVYILDRQDGRLKAQVDTAFPSAPVVHNDVAYVGSLGQLMAMDVETGAVKWTVGDHKKDYESRTWYATGVGPDGKLYTLETPVMLAVRNVQGSNYFYLQAGQGKTHDDPTSKNRVLLRCRNPKDGKVEWEVPLVKPFDYLRPLATELLVDPQGKLAWCQFGAAVAAVDLTSHKLAWPTEKALDDVAQKMNKVSWDRRVKAEAEVSPDQALVQTCTSSGVSHGMVLANGRLYYGSYDLDTEGGDRAYLVIARPDTGQEVKRIPCPGRPTPPLVHDGVIYFGASHTGRVRRGHGEPASWLYAYNESTCEELWRVRVNGDGFSYAPQIVGRTLYYSDGDQFYSLSLPER